VVVSPGRRSRALVLCFLAVAAGVSAQEKSAPARRLLFFFSVGSAARWEQAEQTLLRESFLARLTGEDAPFRVVEWAGKESPADDAARTEAALAGDCDAWAAVEMLGDREKPGYRLRSFDLVTRKRVVDRTFTRDAALRARDLELRFWDEAAADLAAGYRSVENGTRVTIHGAPATIVTGLPGPRLVLDAQGRTDVVLPNPSLYSIRATHRLYQPLNLTFSLKDVPVDVDLAQVPAPRYVVDAALVTLNFLSVGGGMYVLPNYAYVKLGLTTYLAGLAFGGDKEGGVFVSEPLTVLRLEAGSYVNPPDAAIRYYGGVGGLLRLVHARDFFGLEPIAPFGLQAVVGLEGRPWPKASAFFELTPTWYIARDADLLSASYPTDYSFAGARVASGVIDFAQYRVGVRFHL
jgi:hypothetical protein